MTRSTKARQFPPKVRQLIAERDKQCLFCKKFYHMPRIREFGLQIPNTMHIVNKSQGGLGIEQNGVLGCEYHHHLLDNGNKGLREEMVKILETYMIGLYPGWDRDNLVYKK